jgi:Macrocin-O-methyltransferase (TylF)
MLGYLKRRYAASVAHRVDAAVQELEARLLARLETGRERSWSGGADPFELHGRAAVEALAQGVAAIYGYDVVGDVAEFGTMTGRTAAGLARSIASCDKSLGYAAQIYDHPPKKLVLFDSFVGLPEVAKDSVDGQSPHVTDGVWSPGTCRGVSPEELGSMIRSHLAADRFEIHPGWFSDTIPALDADRRFALIHVDSDLYQSAIDVLRNLFSRGMVSRGAYIFFDDWNCNRADPQLGERRAWRECAEEYGIECSDMGSYGVFARCFVVHSYRGSPEDIPGRKREAGASGGS